MHGRSHSKRALNSTAGQYDRAAPRVDTTVSLASTKTNGAGTSDDPHLLSKDTWRLLFTLRRRTHAGIHDAGTRLNVSPTAGCTVTSERGDYFDRNGEATMAFLRGIESVLQPEAIPLTRRADEPGGLFPSAAGLAQKKDCSNGVFNGLNRLRVG